jgi:hypothetical protein
VIGATRWFLMLAVLAACGSERSAPAPVDALSFIILEGQDQTAEVATELPVAIVVRAPNHSATASPTSP